MRLRIALIAFLILGCGPAPLPNEVAGPVVSCDDPTRFTPLPTLTCEEAIAASTAALGLVHAPVIAMTFAYGAPCPPNWRCALPSPNHGFVIFRFVVGDPIYVTVSEQQGTGLVIAGEAQPLPSGF